MTIQLLKNNSEADGPVIAPIKADGSGFPLGMYYNGYADVAFADTYAELLDILMPGYAADDEAAQIARRITLAANVAAQTQASVMYDADRSDFTDAEWEALTTPRTMKQPTVLWWTHEVPLVVYETAYEPYTDVPRPASAQADGAADAPNLWWIRNVEEEDFLISLHEVGYIRLMQNLTITED
jgi:hypothetical protein